MEKKNHVAMNMQKAKFCESKCSLNQFAVSNSAAGNDPGGCFFGGDASGNSYFPDRYDCWLPGWRLPSCPGGGEPYQQ